MLLNQNKPYKPNQHNVVIPDNKQSITITIGTRGFGKSATQELFLESLFEKGWNVFDAWGTGMESMFYCVNLNCKQKRENKLSELKQELQKAHQLRDAEKSDEIIKQIAIKKSELECICHKRYPITILCHESIEIDQKALDKINEVHYSQEEWEKKFPDKMYDFIYPPEKPLSARPKSWIKVVKLPHPSKSDDTKINREIVRIFTDALVSCREEKRILTYVPKLFPDSYSRYRTFAIIVEKLPDIMDEDFKPLSESELGIPESCWTKYQKNHHRICVLMRELGSIAPNNMKGNIFATYTKRAVLSIIRESRNHHITLLGDVQRIEDVFTSIRTQANTVIMKNTTTSLIGDDLQFVNKWIEKSHESMFKTYGYNSKVKDFVYSKYPPLNQLDKNYCYVVYQDDFIDLTEIPNTHHHHKREDDDLYKLIGFSYKINEDLLYSLKETKTKKTEEINADDSELYDFINKMRNPKDGKAISWKLIKDDLVKQQSEGKFKKCNKFNQMHYNSIGRWFKRNTKKFSKPTES